MPQLMKYSNLILPQLSFNQGTWLTGESIDQIIADWQKSDSEVW